MGVFVVVSKCVSSLRDARSVNDKNLSSNLQKAINMPGGHNPLVQHLNVTDHTQDPMQLASQLNSLHSGKFSDQDTDEGMQVPDANLLQGDFICAVFKNSIQHTIVGTLKSWDQGESNYQTMYVTTMPYYLQIHTHVCLALKIVARQIAYLWHVVGEDIPQDALKNCDLEEPPRSSESVPGHGFRRGPASIIEAKEVQAFNGISFIPSR